MIPSSTVVNATGRYARPAQKKSRSASKPAGNQCDLKNYLQHVGQASQQPLVQQPAGQQLLQQLGHLSQQWWPQQGAAGVAGAAPSVPTSVALSTIALKRNVFIKTFHLRVKKCAGQNSTYSGKQRGCQMAGGARAAFPCLGKRQSGGRAWRRGSATNFGKEALSVSTAPIASRSSEGAAKTTVGAMHGEGATACTTHCLLDAPLQAVMGRQQAGSLKLSMIKGHGRPSEHVTIDPALTGRIRTTLIKSKINRIERLRSTGKKLCRRIVCINTNKGLRCKKSRTPERPHR